MSPHKIPAVSRRAVIVGTAAVTGTAALAVGGGLAAAEPASGRRGIGQKAIDEATAELEDGLVALRRDLHAHPEVADEEDRTARVVAKRLRRAGLRVETGIGGYGVVGVLKGARPGRTVAFRADMDAVPPQDQVGGGDKPAHLCGHDIHTTVGVGVAEVLARLRDRLRGTVVFVFQPAEERLTGAKAMLADRKFARYHFDEIHALHCGPFFAGGFGVMPGTGFAGQDRPEITVAGPGAAAKAERLVAELNELSTVSFPESPADLEQLVTDILTPDGPLETFVSLFAGASEPDAEGRVGVRASYRSWPDGRYREVRDRIAEIVAGHEGAEVVFDEEQTYPAMLVSERDGNAVGRHLKEVFGSEPVHRIYATVPFSGEDFAYFLDGTPGTYTFLGVGRPDSGIETAYPHFGSFDPDERAIGFGVRGMAGWLANRCRD